VAKWVEDPSAFFRKVEHKLWKLKKSIREAKEKTEQIKEITKLGAAKKVDQMVVNGPSPADLLISRLPKTFTSRNRGNLSILRCADDFLDPEP
jgi:hypothetical protein